ncbi:MAG: hypothetical protein HS127_07835 [Planctomycetia bacterium]|nr:hypothetical protein [Planctomycetia bacterium]
MDEGKRRNTRKQYVNLKTKCVPKTPEKLKELLEYLNVNSMRSMAPGVLLSAGMAFSFGGLFCRTKYW